MSACGLVCMPVSKISRQILMHLSGKITTEHASSTDYCLKSTQQLTDVTKHKMVVTQPLLRIELNVWCGGSWESSPTDTLSTTQPVLSVGKICHKPQNKC